MRREKKEQESKRVDIVKKTHLGPYLWCAV